ncbi:MAG: RluA family pseudouridine synthase [Nitrospirae bacterium]|nr:MAG: RluA family pseudouridine synthase [Nitrospirota bacterium]
MPQAETRTELLVTAGEGIKRLDHFLATREPFYSRTALQRLIEEGHIRVNDRTVKPSHKIKPGDRITLILPRPQPIDLTPEPIPLDILYEDDAVLVLNKQAGLVVHPAPGHWTGTLVNALLHHLARGNGTLSTIGGRERPGLVHRLDKDTTGVLVIAKTDQAHRFLSAQFKRHSIQRIYEALVWGAPKSRTGQIEVSIGRDTKDRKKFSARTTRPKSSLTMYQLLEQFGDLASRVELVPGTGRTHQLRVHLTSIGCPILGDLTYGGKKVVKVDEIATPRVMLHARDLGFIHPVSQQRLLFHAPLPRDMMQLIEKLRTITKMPVQQ